MYMGIHSFDGNAGTPGTAGSATGKGPLNHWRKILARENSQASLYTAGQKFICQSACMDVFIVNKGGATAVIEAYYIVARKDMPPTGNSAYVEDLYVDAFSDLAVTGSGTALSAVALGTTPFNAPDFCSQFRIYKKLRIQLGAGATTTFQIRDPKNRVIRSDDVEYSAIRRGITRGILLQVYGLPDGTNTFGPAELAISHNTVYNYYRLESNQNTGVRVQ